MDKTLCEVCGQWCDTDGVGNPHNHTCYPEPSVTGRVDHTKPNISAKPSIQWKGVAAEFVQWTKDHPASWDLSVMLSEGKISHFMDPETDNAWMGFQAGWRAQRKITEDALEDLKVSEATLRGEHTSLSDMYDKVLEDQKISLQKADKVADLIALIPEVLAALDATGVNVSLAADVRKALQ